MSIPEDDRQAQQLRERISKLSNPELLQILKAPPDDYTPLALGIAREELARRGGEDAIQLQVPLEVPKESESGLDERACPKCDGTDIRKHSGCGSVVIAVVISIVLAIVSGLSGQSESMMPIVVVASIAMAFSFAAILLTGFSALFGKNKCKACGNRWR